MYTPTSPPLGGGNHKNDQQAAPTRHEAQSTSNQCVAMFPISHRHEVLLHLP